MPYVDKAKKDAAVRLTIKALETGESKYANQALKIGNLKDAYTKLGVLDRIILNMGRADLQAQGKPSADPGTLYRAGQSYLQEYFNQELTKTRIEQEKLNLAKKPLFRNIDLTGNLFGAAYAQGKRDWTAEEAQVVFNAKYQMGILALSQAKEQGGSVDGSSFPETVKIAKSRIEKVRDDLVKKYAANGMTPNAEQKIWQDTVRIANSPSDATFRNDWILWYNWTQAITGLPPDGEARFKEIINFPAKGVAARFLRLFFHDFAVGPSYQSPPTSGLITPEQKETMAGAERTATQAGLDYAQKQLTK